MTSCDSRRSNHATGASRAARPVAAPRHPAVVIQASGQQAAVSADIRAGPVASRGAAGQASTSRSTRVESGVGPTAAAAAAATVSVGSVEVHRPVETATDDSHAHSRSQQMHDGDEIELINTELNVMAPPFVCVKQFGAKSHTE